jgi:pre-mRNA-splicing helicase BRR2
VLGSVNNLKEGVSWLGYTYLYVRMLRNPIDYGITPEEIEEDPHLIKRRVNLIHSAATTLDKSGLIKYDRRSNIFSSTALGKISSYYYIKHESITIYN